jgi:hypothetical protein
VAWWRFRAPERSDDEIRQHIIQMVEAGEIRADQAVMFERALRSEADGKSTIMRNPQIKPKPPRRPRWG